MKHNFKSTFSYLFISILFLFSYACNKDISLNPSGFVTTDVTSETQLSNQLAGIYNPLQLDAMYGNGLWGYFTGGNDEGFNTGSTSTTSVSNSLIEGLRSSSNDAGYYNLWKGLYSGIERANILLSVVNKPIMDERKRANIKGQALFLRAYYFYLLVNNYGDVPYKTIVTSEMGTDLNLAETPSKAIYDSIIKDMEAADSLVYPMSQIKTTLNISQSAVEAVLARVCLSAAGYPINGGFPYYKKALYWSEKLINANVHTLNTQPHPQYPNTPSYARLFINNMQNNFAENNTTEGIWDVGFVTNGVDAYSGLGYLATQKLGVIMGVQSTYSFTNSLASGSYRPYPSFYQLFDNNDTRRDWVMPKYAIDTGNNKYGIGTKATIVTPTKLRIKDSVFIRGKKIIIYDTTFYGSGATAYATIDYNTGGIISLTLTNGGRGYDSIRNITIGTSPGKNGKFKAILNPIDSSIVSLTQTVPGTGYVTIYDFSIGKWRREFELNQIKSNTLTTCYFPVIRYSDVLLMAAEADIQVRGGGTNATSVGLGYYNQVRNRAYNNTGLGIASAITMDDIKDERSRELCFEAIRRTDLKRWGISSTTNALNKVLNVMNTYNTNTPPASAILGATTTSIKNFLSFPQKYFFFPIPAGEIALDPALSQNIGW